MHKDFQSVVDEYTSDKESVYNTWFMNEPARLKAFRSIRRGVAQVVDDIRDGSFGNDFKGSSLEFVLNSITEQKQVFIGAAHAFYWKPRLRIPDIYESSENQRAFGVFLENCLNATREDQLLKEILRLDARKIKGLGPAVANILYFLHPEVFPPCNTAIVNGFNHLFKDKVKLGSWPEYLRMREVILEKNREYRKSFSRDLGAFSGLLFDIGVGKIAAGDEGALDDKARAKIGKMLEKRHKEVMSEQAEEDLHTEMQYHLLKVGAALGYDVISASNARSRCHDGHNFSFISLADFPDIGIAQDTAKTVALIDVIWFEKGTSKIVCAFEVEKSTSIYSGILRLTDLHYSFSADPAALYLVIPDARKREVEFQLSRPAISAGNIEIPYILFSDLRRECDALCKYGEDKEVLRKISKLVGQEQQ